MGNDYNDRRQEIGDRDQKKIIGEQIYQHLAIFSVRNSGFRLLEISYFSALHACEGTVVKSQQQ